MDKALILIGILLASILIVENMVFNLSAYVLIWNSNTGNLAIACIVVGAVMGFGIRGLISSTSSSDDTNDDF